MRTYSLSILFSLTSILVTPALASDDTCADRSVVASAVRTPGDVEAFVQCAYEFVQEVGFAEARRAFNEDERWKSGPIYVSVTEVTSMRLDARSFVFPPDPSREGHPWGPLTDAFGDFYEEMYRIVSIVDEGWTYYAFTNPATGRDEPKASYVKRINWDGTPAVIGTGIYRRDLPGTCEAQEVNAGLLESDPSNARLQEFVRCAALELEANGYFAIRALSRDPRWRNQFIYLFGLDTNGNPLFSGNPYSQSWWGGLSAELSDHMDGPFEGRDVVSVGDAFGETFLYYATRNPFTGTMQRKAAFVKRVVVSGLPILVGSGYYLDAGVPSRPGDGGSGTTYGSTAAACEAARRTLADFPAMRVNYGFYTDFNPVSYSVTQGSAAQQPMGYEPDLVAAIEALSGGRLSFNALGIGNPFSGIWLKAAQEPYDMVGGGITALPERTGDAEGRPVIRFGVGHIRFSQSLLVRAASAIERHSDLTSEHRVGALRGTTGEKRLLELTGIIDTAGFLHAGTRVLLADGTLLTAGPPDSETALRIAAGTGSAAIATRVRLTPPEDNQPEVLYYDTEDELINALVAGTVDAVARGEIGNRIAVRDTPGLRLTAIDTGGNEQGAFSYPDTPAGNVLRETMNTAIACLTANGTIGFAEWFASGGTIFAQRAEQWH